MSLRYLPNDAHTKPHNVATSRKKNMSRVCSAMSKTLQTTRAPATGARQYPNTQTDWKNDLANEMCQETKMKKKEIQ